MAELKTKPNNSDVESFLNTIEDESKRNDSLEILKIMKEISGAQPVMWGGSIIGFGNCRYRYASGREGDWFLVGFSPRKQNFSIYLMSCENNKRAPELFAKLGKHKTGKACLYVNKLSDIDIETFKELIRISIKETEEKYS